MKKETAAREACGALDLIEAGRMMADLEVLSGWTKHAGTASEAESLRFLERLMVEAGFATHILSHDAYISLPGKAELTVGQRQFRCITHSMAVPTGAGGVGGSLVDLRAGGAEAFAAQSVQGRIALIDGIANPAVAMRLSHAGASAGIHVSPHEHLHEMCLSPVWGNPSLQTKGALPTVPVITVSAEDGAAIRALLAGGDVAAHIVTEVDTGWRPTPILVAEMAAPKAVDDSFVLFSAHHDTWHYGVMDNGSADISVVEVARILATERDSWRRGLRICFWSGHSQGRYSSSAWYADNYWHDLDANCVAHVNIDSPGGIGAVNLTGAGVMAALRPLGAAAIAAETGQLLRGVRKTRSADESFQSLGIPSMFGSMSGHAEALAGMRNRLGWWWHTPDDLLDKIDAGNLVRDARILWRCLHPLLTSDHLPIRHEETVSDLEKELAGLADPLQQVIDLEPARQVAARLRSQLEILATAAVPARCVNRAIQAVSRLLIPLDYGHGDRFTHQPALGIAAWPVLDPLRALARLAQPAGHDRSAVQFALVDARRALNRLHHHLLAAEGAVAEACDGSSTIPQEEKYA